MIWKECFLSLERKPLTNDGRGFVFIWRLARFSKCLYNLHINSRYSLMRLKYFMPILSILRNCIFLTRISCWSDTFMPISRLIRTTFSYREVCRGENIWGLWKEEWRTKITLLLVSSCHSWAESWTEQHREWGAESWRRQSRWHRHTDRTHPGSDRLWLVTYLDTHLHITYH